MAIPNPVSWPRELEVQTWTRCRISKERCLPHSPGDHEHYPTDRTRWQEPLELLARLPGYRYHICGRNIEAEEEVLIVITWEDQKSLQSFIASEAYSAYFTALFGQSTPPSPSAFFTLENPRDILVQSGHTTIWTFSFTPPVATENKLIRYTSGLDVRIFTDSRLRLRNKSGWTHELQVLGDGREVEQGFVIQHWPRHIDHRLGLNSVDARQEWERSLQAIRALHVEEVTWYMGLTEAEEEEAKRYLLSLNSDNIDTDDGLVDDEAEDLYTRLAEDQLLRCL